MSLPHITVSLIIMLLLAYIIGARYPALARMVNLAS